MVYPVLRIIAITIMMHAKFIKRSTWIQNNLWFLFRALSAIAIDDIKQIMNLRPKLLEPEELQHLRGTKFAESSTAHAASRIYSAIRPDGKQVI